MSQSPQPITLTIDGRSVTVTQDGGDLYILGDNTNDSVQIRMDFYELGTNRPVYMRRIGKTYKDIRFVKTYDPDGAYPYGVRMHIDVEATQKQYERVTGLTPSDYGGDKRPVERVAWADVAVLAERHAAQADQGQGRIVGQVGFGLFPFRAAGSPRLAA